MNKVERNMVTFKDELNSVMAKYGYEVRRYILDERTGRSSHKQASLELFLEPIEDQD